MGGLTFGGGGGRGGKNLVGVGNKKIFGWLGDPPVGKTLMSIS